MQVEPSSSEQVQTGKRGRDSSKRETEADRGRQNKQERVQRERERKRERKTERESRERETHRQSRQERVQRERERETHVSYEIVSRSLLKYFKCFFELSNTMVKKTKGKHRLDKFYHLAKEQG